MAIKVDPRVEKTAFDGIRSEADPMDPQRADSGRRLPGETRYRIVQVDPLGRHPEFGGIRHSTDTKPPEEQP
jgi:hypothetical protein